MTPISVGKIRGLRELTTPEGAIVILALDHRGSLARMLGIPGDDPELYTKIRDFKLTILERLLPYASAALLDLQYAAAEAVVRGAVPGHKGFIVSIEKSGYSSDGVARVQQILPGWSVAKSKRMGASGIKLLIEYNPDVRELAAQQEQLVAAIAEQARVEDLPFLVEPVTYAADPRVPKDSAEFAAQRPRLIVETARRIGAQGPDVLKLEFPHDARYNTDEAAWADACAAITEASPVPWAMLSAGVDFDTFKRQVRAACQAGASGYVAGRSFWKEATSCQGDERLTFLQTVAAARMTEAAEVARTFARPWTACYPEMVSAVTQGWHATY